MGQPVDSVCQVHKSISSIARESFQLEINHCLKSSSEKEEKEEREKYFPVENIFCDTGYYLWDTRNYFLVTWASILFWKLKGVFIAIKCIETPRDL